MSRPPLISKEKTNPRRPAPRPKRARTLILSVFMLLLMCGWSATIVIIIGRPDIIGYERVRDARQTDSAIQGTVGALALTADTIGTQIVTQGIGLQEQYRQIQETRSALEIREQRAQATETQQILYAQFTQTANANFNAQQATQSALDAAATVSAINQLATQARQSFDATQTAIAGSWWTPAPTAPPNIAIIEGGFENLSENSTWQGLPPTSAWALVNGNALAAQNDAATLLTSRTDFGASYTVQARFQPSSVNTDVNLLFGLTDGGAAYGLRAYYVDGRVISIVLFRFERATLGDPLGLPVTESQIVEIVSGDLVTGIIDLRVQVSGADVTAFIGAQQVITATLERSPIQGAAGVQAKTGTQVISFTVE